MCRRGLFLALCIVIFLSAATAMGAPQAEAGGVSPAPAASSTSATQANGTPARSLVGVIKDSRPAFRISLGKIFWTMVVFALGWIVIRTATRLSNALAERWVHYRFTIKALVPLIRILGWMFVIFLIIDQVWAPPIEAILAVTASAGIAIGFASQDILKNIFGGITIVFDRPFQVGDKIEVGKYYGEVVHIGLRTVRIVTQDDSLVSIPNSEIISQSVSNANAGAPSCQVVSEYYLPPQIDLVQARKIAFQAAAVSRYVFLDKPIVIIFKNEVHLGRSMLKMRLKAYVLDHRFEFPFMSEMTEIVVCEYLKRGLVAPEELSPPRIPR